MTAKLRWGILGTGNIARQFAAGVQAGERGMLVAVASRSLPSAQKFAADFSVALPVEGYQGLLNLPDIDAVYISLPNSMHRQWTLAALAAGKHVLCEKPIGINADEAVDMFDAAERAGRVLVEAFMYRSHPLTLAVEESLRRGEIGKLRLIRSSFCFATSKIAGNIRFDPALSGGSLMDVGCYCVNFSRHFTGAEPLKIDAVGHIHQTGVDDLAAGTLEFPLGVLATFASALTVHADNTAILCGTEGYIEIPVPWKPPSPESIFIVSRSVPPRMDAATSKTPPPAAGSSPRDVRRITASKPLYAIEADDFAATVLDGKPPRLDRRDSIGNMRVLDELRRQVGLNY